MGTRTFSTTDEIALFEKLVASSTHASVQPIGRIIEPVASYHVILRIDTAVSVRIMDSPCRCSVPRSSNWNHELRANRARTSRRMIRTNSHGAVPTQKRIGRRDAPRRVRGRSAHRLEFRGRARNAAETLCENVDRNVPRAPPVMQSMIASLRFRARIFFMHLPTSTALHASFPRCFLKISVYGRREMSRRLLYKGISGFKRFRASNVSSHFL